MIKSNKKVTLKTRETYFLYRKSQKLKIEKNVLRKLFPKKISRKISLYSLSRIVSKKSKVASYRRNNKLRVSFKNGLKWIKAF